MIYFSQSVQSILEEVKSATCDAATWFTGLI
jgi:hypothetical protein